MKFSLGISTCFAIKHWSEPHVFMDLVKNKMGLDIL